MQKLLIVGSWYDYLQAIESLRAQAVAETSARIVTPSDYLQAIESLNYCRKALKHKNIESLCYQIVEWSSRQMHQC